MAALLLIIPRTALLGAVIYFPIILNICVLTYAVRFEGTRIATLMLLANLFLLVWDYDRLSHVLPFRRHDENHHALDKNSKFPILGRLFSLRHQIRNQPLNPPPIAVGETEQLCTDMSVRPMRDPARRSVLFPLVAELFVVPTQEHFYPGKHLGREILFTNFAQSIEN